MSRGRYGRASDPDPCCLDPCACPPQMGDCDDGNPCTIDEKVCDDPNDPDCASFDCLNEPLCENDGNTCTTNVCNVSYGDCGWPAGAEVAIPNAPHASIPGAPLVCEAWPSHAQAWSAANLSLFGSAVVPGSVYEVSMCDESGMDCASPATVYTGQWGDIVAPFGGSSQPNIGDVMALIDKLRGLPSAPGTPRADLVGAGDPNGGNIPDHLVNIADISAGVDAFRGFPYPYSIPSCP